jgi:hypothetical protein
MGVKEIECEGVACLHLAQDWICWRVLVNTAMETHMCMHETSLRVNVVGSDKLSNPFTTLDFLVSSDSIPSCFRC